VVPVEAFFFFFFQAEDGIRDYKVTGVQTCALPILAGSGGRVVSTRPLPENDPRQRRPDISRARALLGWEPRVSLEDGLRRTVERSEERRVGKECRAGGALYRSKKKEEQTGTR